MPLRSFRHLPAAALLCALAGGAGAQEVTATGCDGRLSLSAPLGEAIVDVVTFSIQVANISGERVPVRFTVPAQQPQLPPARFYAVEPGETKRVQLGRSVVTGDKAAAIAAFWLGFQAACPPPAASTFLLRDALPLP